MATIDFAFPAGDESEVSGDEWDIGSTEKKAPAEQDVVEAVLSEDDPVTLLKKAISKQLIQTVEQLLDTGLDVDTRLDFDWTPLMCAVSVANYDLTKMLLDRGASANFSKDHWTVLMSCCTASAPEEKICSCVELLLSRNADPNMTDRSNMTCLMLASRDGYSKVINLLVSHRAAVNTQDFNGYTALCYAVQYGREESVLKLLQLGADKTIKTRTGRTALELALAFRHTQIGRILTSNAKTYSFFSEESRECTNKLDDLELLLHGLDLGFLTDIITDHDVSWSQLLTMDRDDLHKLGITEPEHQQKVLSAVQQMELDKVDLQRVCEVGADDAGSEEMLTFLLSVRQQCSYLTESIQDVVSRFPRRASKLVFSLDPKGEAQLVCNQLLIQTKDLQKELTLLRNLLAQVDQAEDCCEIPAVPPKTSWRRGLRRVVLSVLGASALFLLVKSTGVKPHLRVGGIRW